jgi:hypothetical protein
MYRINNDKTSALDKLAILLRQERKLFHTSDLALLWQISNKNTLYTTIKRYVKKGVLISVCKGFYSTVPLSLVNPVKLGIAFLHKFAYLSAETVCFQAGVINQSVSYITLISSVSKKFKLNNQWYLSRKMKDEFLFNNLGVNTAAGFKKAGLERAVADLLYYNPNYYFDNKNLIDFKKVLQIQRKVGFK